MPCLASGKLGHLSSFVFLMLLVGKKKEHAVWTSTGAQVLRYWDANRLQASGQTCAKVRKVQGTMSHPQGLLSLPHWPPGSESSLQVLRGVFMRPISSLADTLLPPVGPTHCQTPQQGLGRRTYCTGYSGSVQVSAGKKELQVCDSSPPDSQSQSPMRFSYYPPISLPLAPLLDLIPLHSLLHFIKKPFQKVNTLPE